VSEARAEQTGLHQRNCPVCGSSRGSEKAAARIDTEALDDYAYASRKVPELMHHRLVLCADCGSVYASPAPAPETLEAAYRSAAYDSGIEAAYAAATYARALRRDAGDSSSWAPALDIGAGDGAFLAELRKLGVDPLVGIEPSEAPIAAAAPEMKPLLQLGSFDPARHEPDSFGLVTCFQTIEHVDDPLELCRGAHRLLRPGGRLAIVCHDYRAIPNRLMGRRSPVYDIEHLQLLSKGPVRELLDRAGFASIAVRPLVNRYPLRYWARLAPLPGPLKDVLLGALRGRLGSPGIPLPVGNLLAIGTKRPG
jgi:SAM-dependent methyltransferase